MRKNRVVRFSDSEWELIGAAAARDGKTRAGYLRQIASHAMWPIGQKCEVCYRQLPHNDYLPFNGKTVRGTGFAHAQCAMKAQKEVAK